MCVFTLSCFLAKSLRSFAIVVRYLRKYDEDRWRRSKGVFGIRFYLQHGILGLLLVLQDSCRG